MPTPSISKRTAAFGSHARFWISTCVVAAAFWFAGSSPTFIIRVIWAWLAGSSTMLLLSLNTMIHAEVHHIKAMAAKQDPGQHVIFGLVVAGAWFSLLAIGYLIGGTKGMPQEDVAWHLALSGVTILCSWLLIHSAFTFRYAHLYYMGHHNGLSFPSTEEPDYLDFAYFAFVIGMTGQVSDVTISSRTIRRVALAHGILSFVFNTIILAMSINLLAGML